MKVALLANLAQTRPLPSGQPTRSWPQFTSWDTIQAIMIALEKFGHQVVFLEGDETLYNNLLAVKPDICFNLCQGRFGSARKAQIPAILEMLRLPYTGSQPPTLILDELKLKQILLYYNLPTPPFHLFEGVDESPASPLQFPLLVKPSREIVDKEASIAMIARDKEQLYAHLQSFFNRYQQPALVERLIEGQEISIGLVGNLNKPTISRLSTAPTLQQELQDWRIFPPLLVRSMLHLTKDDLPSPEPIDGHTSSSVLLSEEHVANLEWLAATTFQVLGCLDVAQIRFRLDAHDEGKPYLIAVETLPDLNPDYSELYRSVSTTGWSYETLVNFILDTAIRRYQLATHPNQHHPPADSLEDEAILPFAIAS